MGFQKIDHKCLYKDVIDQLERYIEDRNLEIGDKLPTERELAEQLGISRGTVREAYRILEDNHILETRPGGGRFMRGRMSETKERAQIIEQLEQCDLLDMLELRSVIEIRAVEMVIDTASDDDIIAIRNAMSKSNDPYENDSMFHLALAEASGNNALYNVLQYNLSILSQIRHTSLKTPGRSEKMKAEHNEILNYIIARDKEQATQTLRRHFDRIRQSILLSRQEAQLG